MKHHDYRSEIFISGLLNDNEMKSLLLETGAGLESIRFGISDNLDHADEQMREAKRLLSEWGHPRLWLHGPFQDLSPVAYDSLVQEATRIRFEQAYAAAEELGASGIVFHSGMIPATHYVEGWAERTAAFFMRFLEGKSGIDVMMENVYDREIEPLRQVLLQVQQRFPQFGFCLDLGHAHCYSGRPVSEWVERMAPYVCHVHVHDNDGTIDSHLALGSGTIPYRDAIETMKQQPQSISWTIECSTKERVLKTYSVLASCLSETTDDHRSTI